jgi:hypothetical protein
MNRDVSNQRNDTLPLVQKVAWMQTAVGPHNKQKTDHKVYLILTRSSCSNSDWSVLTVCSLHYLCHATVQQRRVADTQRADTKSRGVLPGTSTWYAAIVVACCPDSIMSVLCQFIASCAGFLLMDHLLRICFLSIHYIISLH